jgi:hypothetical protein
MQMTVNGSQIAFSNLLDFNGHDRHMGMIFLTNMVTE